MKTAFTKLEQFVARNSELSDKTLAQQLNRTARGIAQVRNRIAVKEAEREKLRKLIKPWRYFNIVAVTSDARPISTQVWACDNGEEAEATLKKWYGRKDYGLIVHSFIHDTRSGKLRHFVMGGIEQV